jgi:hypothetical protein
MKWILVFFLTGCLTSRGFAVDQSKFRTCDQTSFCRRHRGEHSAALYKYRLDKKSVHFHLPSEENDAQKENAETVEKQKSSGLWKSLQDRILGGSDDSEGKKDPYYRGTVPTLTGVLVNTATKTSTGHKESLELSVYGKFHGRNKVKLYFLVQLLTVQFDQQCRMVCFDLGSQKFIRNIPALMRKLE